MKIQFMPVYFIILGIAFNVFSNTGKPQGLSTSLFMDPNITDEIINTKLEHAILGSDLTDERLAIQELGKYTELVQLKDTRSDLRDLVVRPIHDVPQLKERLILHFRSEHAQSGYSTSKQASADFQRVLSEELQPSDLGTSNNSSNEIIDGRLPKPLFLTRS